MRDTTLATGSRMTLISFSECDCQQEALLLMPDYGFVCTELGTFFLEPFALQPWTARLRMESGFGDTSCVTQKAPFNQARRTTTRYCARPYEVNSCFTASCTTRVAQTCFLSLPLRADGPRNVMKNWRSLAEKLIRAKSIDFNTGSFQC
jgi:hypothetical protein